MDIKDCDYNDLYVIIVTVETVEEGHKRTQHFTVDTLHEDSIIKSLILSINQTQPGAHGTLYIDCVSYGMVATPKSMRDMFTSMNNPRVHVVSVLKQLCNKLNHSFNGIKLLHHCMGLF